MADPERSAMVRLFHLKHLRGDRGKLSVNIIREVCEYLAGHMLAHVASTFLCFFDLRTSTWGSQVRLRTPIQADKWSRWAMLEGRVFCCGGYGIAAAYLLTRDGAVDWTSYMNTARMYHGLQTANNAAYVFGGVGLRTCEKWEEATNWWTNLPSMSEGRSDFNPCLWEEKIYLCGMGSIEVFDPQTDSFLPHLLLPEACVPCCVCVYNRLLVVHSNTCILKFAEGPDGQLTLRSQVTSPDVPKYQNSQPVVAKTKGVIYMIQEEKCVSFVMETGVEGLIVALG